MPRISQKLIQALPYAILIWAAGFIWGSLVFMTPSLRAISPIRFVSSNPAISFPILAGWLVLSWLLARSYLKSAEHKASEGIELGAILAGVNILLDLFVLVVLLRAGMRYFASLTVWLGYLILLLVPWIVGRSLESSPEGSSSDPSASQKATETDS